MEEKVNKWTNAVVALFSLSQMNLVLTVQIQSSIEFSFKEKKETGMTTNEWNLWAITFPGRPSFFIDGDICGIVNENHAARIAHDILGLPMLPEFPDKRIVVEKV